MSSISVVTGPTIEPVTLQQAKDFLRVTFSDDDDFIASLIQGARELLEIQTQRSLITRTLKLTADAFPNARVILLPKPPLQSISSVKYIADGDTSLTTLSTAYYSTDTASTPGRLILNDGYSWPITETNGNAVEITYVAGYGAAVSLLPFNLQQAVLLYVSHFYQNRSVVNPVQLTMVPRAIDALAFPYKVHCA